MSVRWLVAVTLTCLLAVVALLYLTHGVELPAGFIAMGGLGWLLVAMEQP